ncbi:hypothetical protein LUX01_22110 [Streptomyces sudanensis]|uniref:hypothetical protein n=1 Tax=Streptomyces sudanensis TaxID=436397 RepID=UPI0020CF5974|nr:hypothetical protein [Streptomyces sudanensis]MCP9988941.1 hypothetical protein [Streptomyces sudanensis]
MTYGRKNTPRKKPRSHTVRCSSRAVPSDRPTVRGTKNRVYRAVTPRLDQNRSSFSSRA